MGNRRFQPNKCHPVVVCLIEENPLAQQQLSRTLRQDRGIHFVPFCKVGAASVAARGKAIVVVDRGTLSSPFAHFVRLLHRRAEQAKAIVLDRDCPKAELVSMLALGVYGFVPYREVEGKLRQAIHTVAEDHLWIPAEAMEKFVRQSFETGRRTAEPCSDLTSREREILELIGQKLQNKEIAAALGISQSTVKFRLANVLTKLSVRARSSAVEMAVTANTGWLAPGESSGESQE